MPKEPVSILDAITPKPAAEADVPLPEIPAGAKLTSSEWAKRKKVEPHWHAGAAALRQWDEHLQVSEADFDKAIDAVKSIRIG